MKKLLIILISFPIALFAQEEQKAQDQIMGLVGFYAERVSQLAEAIPEDKYGYKPSDQVRSAGEAVMHVASANYWLSMKMGAELPSDMNLMTYEKSVTGKENIKAALAKSYEFLMASAKAVKDDQLLDSVEFPGGMPMNKRGVMLIALSHVSEHMGQLIAYARANDVVPPWSE
ncbi:MAG: DinB family protein [Bacteroidota bacterium]